MLRMQGINKQFFGVPVLEDAQLEVLRGEVHVLLGENGAGKSTLIKILSGAYARESGSIELDGRVLPPMNPKEALDAGIRVIYQEFNLVPDLPVYENIFLGKEYGRHMVMDHKRTIEAAVGYMQRVGLDVDPKTPVRNLSVAQKQLVEIAKAISNQVKILVLDEPTASITDKETQMLFEIIRTLQREGVGIIYISHRMNELFQIGSRCTVMRNGRTVGTVRLNEITEAGLTKMMVGKAVEVERKQNLSLDMETVVLKVENLSDQHLLKDISFELHKGEILGFAGLVGAGRSEVAKCIVGARKKSGGAVTYKGRVLSRSLVKNIRRGIVYLSEDRKDEGLILAHSVMDNIALPNLKKLAKPFINKRKMLEKARHYIDRLSIKIHSPLSPAKCLSGGNQQKVVIAKWLYAEADVYIFDEPTRGIDVGARAEIYQIMRDLIAQGASIMMISSDLIEILKLSDRVAVMRDGVLEAVLVNDQTLTQETVLKYAMSGRG